MTTTTPASAPATQTPPSWAGVFSLGLGIFAIVMSEFLPASLLPPMAEDLGVTTGAAGQAVTTTAVAAALSALLVAVILPRVDRRLVMMGLTLLAVVSDLLVAVSPNLYVVLAARLLLGVALGGFWAMATAMAAHLVPADRLGRALTVINSGVALATVVAIPLGAWLGGVWGWRGVFVLGAGIATLALVLQAATLPRVSPAPGGGLRALGHVLRSGLVVVGLLAVLLVFTGHFSGFTYIRPAAESLSGIDADGFAVLLVVFGVTGVVGTALAGPLADRTPRLGMALFPAATGIGMLVMHTAGSSTTWLFLGAAVWGFGFGGIPTTVLSWGARTQPARLEQIGAVIVTVCNIAVAAGAVAGGLLVDHAAATGPLLLGGVVAIAGAVVLTNLRRVG